MKLPAKPLHLLVAAAFAATVATTQACGPSDSVSQTLPFSYTYN